MPHTKGSQFLDFLDNQFPTVCKWWENNCKTKEEKVFFFIFMSSYAEMSFFKTKNH
jgi:hypothetical protein